MDFKCPPRCPVLRQGGPSAKSLINISILRTARGNKNKLFSIEVAIYFSMPISVPLVCLVLVVRREPQTPGAALWVLGSKHEYSARAASAVSH